MTISNVDVLGTGFDTSSVQSIGAVSCHGRDQAKLLDSD